MNRAINDDRTRTALGALPTLLFHTARDDATTDRWASGMAAYDESMALARETGQTTDLAMSLAGLAWLQARMGRAAECQANADEALTLAERHRIRIRLAIYPPDLRRRNNPPTPIEITTTLNDIAFLNINLTPRSQNTTSRS